MNGKKLRSILTEDEIAKPLVSAQIINGPPPPEHFLWNIQLPHKI